MDISLNKFISDSGYCSRREADKFIEQGRVTINGEYAFKGSRVKPGDKVTVDGEKIKRKQEDFVYLALNKPKGITCTTDAKDKTNIIDFVGYKSRIFPIGRLDKLSEGLIFLTNNGDIVNKILRVGNNHEKEYVVTVDKPFSLEFVNRMSDGIKILGTYTKKCSVVQLGPTKFKIILKQGLNRQIRRMCEALGYRVTSLIRVRIMNIPLANIPSGKWRYLTQEEVAMMLNLLKGSTGEAIKNLDQNGMDE